MRNSTVQLDSRGAAYACSVDYEVYGCRAATGATLIWAKSESKPSSESVCADVGKHSRRRTIGAETSAELEHGGAVPGLFEANVTMKQAACSSSISRYG